MNKLKAQLIQEFSDISDVELIDVYKKTIHDYRKYKVIEKLIFEIMYDNGYSKTLPINHELENRYKVITKLVEARKIAIPKKPGKITIKKEDIIKQVEETSELDAKWIEEHSYLYDGFYDGLENDYTNYESKNNSIDIIAETKKLYSKVLTIIEPSRQVKTR